MKLKAEVYRFTVQCWRCKSQIEVLYPEMGDVAVFGVIPPELAKKLNLKPVYSKTMGEWTYGNICPVCKAYQGWWFLHEDFIFKKAQGENMPCETVEYEVPLDEKAVRELQKFIEAAEEEIKTCPLCGRKVPNLVKHHVSYEPEDVIYICNSCHAKIHKSKGVDRPKQADDKPKKKTPHF